MVRTSSLPTTLAALAWCLRTLSCCNGMAPPVFAWFQDCFTTTVHVLIRRHRCCGNSDCGAAGAGKRDTFALGENGIAQRQAGGSHGSVTMRYGNGTEIPIVEEGYSPEDLYMQSRSAIVSLSN